MRAHGGREVNAKATAVEVLSKSVRTEVSEGQRAAGESEGRTMPFKSAMARSASPTSAMVTNPKPRERSDYQRDTTQRETGQLKCWQTRAREARRLTLWS